MSTSGILNDTKLIGSGSGSSAALQAIPKRKRRTVRLEINSNDRNLVTSTKTSKFRINLKYPLKGITEVRLVNGTIPVPFFNIDDGWNAFTFSEGLKKWTVLITPGFYTESVLIAKLQTVLNTLPGLVNTYTVDIESPSQCIRIRRVTGSQTFGLLFASGNYIDEIDTKTASIISMRSPQTILGFGYSDFYDVGGEIVAPFPPQLELLFRRIYLYLNFDSTIDFRSVDRGQGRKEPSAILYLDSSNTYGSYKTLNQDNYDFPMDCGSAGISRVASIYVEFRDEFDRLLNFNNRTVSLLLEVSVVE